MVAALIVFGGFSWGDRMFVNFSSHSSCEWSSKQRNEARKFGEIVDIAFPDVAPEAEEQQIEETAAAYAAKIIAMKPDVVMCQGEYSLTFHVVLRLLSAHIRVVCACTERCAICTHNETDTKIESLFSFVKFRNYSIKGVHIDE